MQSGWIFNIQKYSVHDGPGIRTTVFLKGCPLSCLWCHNPEGRSSRSEVVLVEERCLFCGACRDACPSGASDGGRGALPALNPSCILCGACTVACPADARQMFGRRMTVVDIVREVLKDRIFYEDSGGGATFSGGEPLSQPAFLQELLQACRLQEIHTAVDTCGYASWKTLESIAGNSDLILYDLKLMNDTLHRQVTGVSNALILENLRMLGGVHSNIWIRVPVIPGVNDNDCELEAIARFAASIPAVRQVNLLPYHRTGIHKAKRMGHACVFEEADLPSAEKMEAHARMFRGFGLRADTGG